MDEEVFDLVKNGYNKIAQKYRSEKTDSSFNTSLYQKWLKNVSKGPVLDLGCGSGYPLLEILSPEIQYLGIDISEAQIKVARNQYPNRKFIQAEMLEYCQTQSENKFNGVIVLFSLFHIPRDLHHLLLAEIKRICQSNAPLLLLVPEEENEGSIDLFLGQEMWWSFYSYNYYFEILVSLGFTDIQKQRKINYFAGEKEINWYLFGFT